MLITYLFALCCYGILQSIQSFPREQMMWRLNIYTICLAFGLNVLIIDIGTAHAETLKTKENYSNDPLGYKNISDMHNEDNSSTYITNIIEKARSKIKYETSNFNFSQHGVHGFEDLVLESGGQPLRTIVVSTWRSGSNFLGDLVTTVYPSTYYNCEPLVMYGMKQFKAAEEVNRALGMVKRMLHCNYEGLKDYFDYARKYLEGKWISFNSHNVGKHRGTSLQYSQECKNENQGEICYDEELTSKICKLYPFQSIKITRLRLKDIEEILAEKVFNAKVILLVRDPRGVMHSRETHPRCANFSDCYDPSVLCAGMVSDYTAARRILQQYPDRLLVMRFEELALQPNESADRILNFLNTQRTQAFDDFLQSHTTVEVAGPFSSYRVSRKIPYKWTSALDFKYVNEIQMTCRDAMNLWGYKMAHNETHMKSEDFNAISDYTI